MKYKLVFITLIVGLLFTLAFTSCDVDDMITENLTVEIDSVPCQVYDSAYGEKVPGMWVRKADEKKWSQWPQNSIKGYAFEAGYYSKLKIKRKRRKDTWDGESPVNTLVKVLEKKPSESVRNK